MGISIYFARLYIIFIDKYTTLNKVLKNEYGGRKIMKFLSVFLSNYIGIYNGMGLYDIHIDMTKCRNRITIIRGDNGSGKSTLSKAMNLFPDSSDCFIPGLPARKEIVLADNETVYKLIFIHGVKSNGEREVTKAYITKTFGNNIVELNENGNVTSYKEILYSELGLDANFAALSQLSNDDRGLADKRPAERKRFVNSIISSLDTYNNIFKTLNKRASSFKSMINSISGKLSVLGDQASIENNLEAVEGKINDLQDKKDKAIVALAQDQSTIKLLDPDGTIQSSNTVINAELVMARKNLQGLQTIIESLCSEYGISLVTLEDDYKRVVNTKNSLLVQNQINRNSVESLISQKDGQTQFLNQRLYKLQQLNNGDSYEMIQEKLKEYRKQMKDIEDQLRIVGISNVSDISKDEYILALGILYDLEESISAFKSCAFYDVIEKIVKEYIETGVVPAPMDVAKYDIPSMQNTMSALMERRTAIISKMSLLNTLGIRPSTCSDDSCPFIKEALEFKSTNPEAALQSIDEEINRLEEEMENAKDYETIALSFNEYLNKFSIIVREVNKNAVLLAKMPNGEMFSNKVLFFDRLISGYGFEYMKQIYQYIDLANLFDIYKKDASICAEYESELRVYESKAESISMLQQEIETINKEISAIVDKIEPINAEIADNTSKIASLQKLEGVYDAIKDNLARQKPLQDKIQECNGKLSENSRKTNLINKAIADQAAHKDELSKVSYALTPLMAERDKLVHSAQLVKEYQDELAKVRTDYEFIETLKYYSSPTTGIQLVFMELYMGKIIALANELLKLLFNGKFEIQPFIINESEFRIPCLGEGYLNDDISSMSSSQIGMISMILSFALLHHSSTKYNIIKLDEIDGPLDYTNRVYFTDVLNSIMDIMHTEQCIMISHNTELQVDNSDVILLKHDENNTDYYRGNIIWKY